VCSRRVARSVLGIDEVVLEPIDTQIGSAGSTSASRQTWMSGGAVDAACRQVRERMFESVGAAYGIDPLRFVIEDDHVVDTMGDLRVPVLEASAGRVFDETAVYRHRPTEDLDENGQGNLHTAFAFAVHRAVVDVDLDLGLVRVVQIATAQDVGVALNPLSVLGQIEGGIAQGLGLAVMEEIVVRDGYIRNASFTDCLLPTLDAPRSWRRSSRSPIRRPHSAPRASGNRPPCRPRPQSWRPSGRRPVSRWRACRCVPRTSRSPATEPVGR
jgi:CO/xanthine dehydrogenase Mo-binding subunit